MKNKPILRWFLIGLVHAVLSLLGFIIVPVIYPFRTFIRVNKIKFLWWFLNDTTKANKNDIDFGDFGRFNNNYFGYIRQCAVRNSHYNFRLTVLIPEIGKKTDIVDYGSLVYSRISGKVLNKLTLCNTSTSWGFQNVTFKINGVSYFRFSLSKKIKLFKLKFIKWKYIIIPIFKIEKVYRVFNIQFGSNSKRYIYKIRFPKIK